MVINHDLESTETRFTRNYITQGIREVQGTDMKNIKRDTLWDIGSPSANAVIARDLAAERLSRLTSREREVLRLLLEGHPNKLIAHHLGISQRTVECHRAAVMRKTGATSVPALTRLAMAAGVRVSDQA